ncbi:hypothetical protein [Alcanivorax sp. 1008]|uniref:hypothetical protein n=1 Tax=Alcanivorax sp. 1008 TaxID=2816853 RepID=UPI001DC474AC|nr:hypothetical protein [Alcanivorax sp. 1008]MCC1497956.1 hypothetical protein [Alcanivorax sp. 1008]
MDMQRIDEIFSLKPAEAWEAIFSELWQQFAEELRADYADAKTTERDRKSSSLDNLLSGSAWELWQEFDKAAPKTADSLKTFWKERATGKAILILDALSLRELPWLLHGAKERGYTLHQQRVTGSEIPGDTTPFAKALGFGQRSNLASNQGKSGSFQDAWTEVSNLPFIDCATAIKADPNIIFWHEWPDSEMHDLADENGYRKLAKSAVERLTSDDFWQFIDRLTTGRRLVITADHGYAHSGLFPDVTDRDQVDYLKSSFKSGRACQVSEPEKPHYWVPPLTQTIQSEHGKWELVLGRRKWKSQGGYPSLTHGGLSLLEVAVPFIEISK